MVSTRNLIILLIGLSGLSPLTLNIVMPSVPGLVLAFGVPVTVVQLVISVYLLGMAFSQLFLGPLSDRFGRRPVLLAALSLNIVASLACTFAPSIEWLIVARLVQSFGASSGIVIGRVIIRDLYARDEAASMIGWVTMAMVVAPMISPSLGGVIISFGNWRWIFGFVTGLSVVLSFWALFALPETRRMASSPSFGQIWRDAKGLMRNRDFIAYASIVIFSASTFFTFLGGSPHAVMTIMGVSSTAFGLWFATTGVGYMLGNAISGRYAVRLGSEKLIVAGAWLGFGAACGQILLAVFGFLDHPLPLFFLQSLIAVANGLQMPSAMAALVSVNPNASGSASGICGFWQNIIGGFSAQLAGSLVIYAQSVTPMVVIVFLAASISVLALRIVKKAV